MAIHPAWPCLKSECEFVFPSGLSVFFPAYNDAASLPRLLERTFATLRRHAIEYEVIVVNDGSRDQTGAVLAELRDRYAPYLRVVTHGENRGYGAALRTGFASCTKEFIFYTDGDGQYDPAELVTLLQMVTPRVGLVNGYKIARSDPRRRIAIGWLYNRFARFMFSVKLRDIDCDFRLIRKSLLDQIELGSTSGTICLELVRKIELLAPEVVETPVHHYPRLHGSSQFFRFRSLATTFGQLWKLYVQFAMAGGAARLPVAAFPMLLMIAALCGLAYGRALTLPFIADDYVQIDLARVYGPVTGWARLASDALYRCRATSLVLTYWTERLFGLDPTVFNASSLLLHILNSWLVFALGRWRLIGWRVSSIAACYFAICQQHQEAVIWYAALPELLVFFFSISSLLAWIEWLQAPARSWKPYAMAIAFFALGLLSKESAVAVVALMALATVMQDRTWRRLPWLATFAAIAVLYFAAAFSNRATHLHFNDGTFSLRAPFLLVIARSALRLSIIWGAVSVAALVYWREWKWKALPGAAAAWIAITLLPYSFLTYMPYVPSRHTYLASGGLAMIVAAGLLAFAERVRDRSWAIWTIATILILHHCTYLWTRKHYQFVERAAPTERLVQFAERIDDVVYIRCFPYGPDVARLALQMRVDPRARPALVFSESQGPAAHAIDLCSPGFHHP